MVHAKATFLFVFHLWEESGVAESQRKKSTPTKRPTWKGPGTTATKGPEEKVRMQKGRIYFM